MKEIKAIIQPFRLDNVLDALHRIEGLPGVIVSEVRAINVQRGRYEQVIKLRLEVIVPDSLAERVCETICRHARTGNPGDGRVFVVPVEDAVDIRSGGRWPPFPKVLV